MKIIIISLVLLSVSFLFAAEIKTDDSMSLAEISSKANIPVAKLIEYLDLTRSADLYIPLSDLKKTNADLQKAISRFQENRQSYHLGIVMVGMFTVFASLALVALLINQLRHFDKKKKTRQVKLPAANGNGFATTEDDDIVAAIVSTLYLYELELEENNKLLLTWKRTPLSMWKAANYIPMNEVDPSRRK